MGSSLPHSTRFLEQCKASASSQVQDAPTCIDAEERLRKLMLLLLSLVISAMLTLVHVRVIDMPHWEGQVLLHRQILEHQAPAPYQFRALQPILVEALCHLMGRPATGDAFVAAYALIRLLCIWATLVAVFVWLSAMFSTPGAALGACLVAMLLPFTYWRYNFQPTSVVEMAGFALALLCAARRRLGWFVLVCLLGMFNRETMIFVPGLWLLWWWRDTRKGELVVLSATFLVCAALYLAMRHAWPVPEDLNRHLLVNMQHNVSNGLGNIDVALMTLPWIAWLLLPSTRRMPAHFRRMALVYVLWVPLHFVCALWEEVRYYLTAMLPILPALVWSLFPEARRD